MNAIGGRAHSTVIVEALDDIEADITIIVHSPDQRLTQALHDVCAQAVRDAVRAFDCGPGADACPTPVLAVPFPLKTRVARRRS